ncbi:nitroreductase family protein [Falsigemmobacter faecalis]|uniref:Methyltransferase domain-containing protein n=1 Tax=Falsigemmobacter faecalis TaxID=2488730 RepID=A0A3P3DFC2_9RHOB|nr:nitroreductase family protein [Falsigemmobacter faecalis]RRH72991.1 methyltransferase domain-containing protein [Falsigemmobacter faecalis]
MPTSAAPLGALDLLAARLSCRAFTQERLASDELNAMLRDALEAPSSCNQQAWHFVVLDQPEDLARAADLAGGNPHFRDCAALVYLCFQKGWTHDNFSVVQGVAAAGYHLMLSAHLRGWASVWNAGTGDPVAVRDLLGLPAIFENQGAIALGRAAPDSPARKPPRRALETVVSYGRFERPEESIYPAKPAPAYPFHAISRVSNPFAEWNPQSWSWAQLADYRAYSVWAKSPLAGVYTSRREGAATRAWLDMLAPLPEGAKVAELLPWGGTSTTLLAGRLPEDAQLLVAELHPHNLTFIRDRLEREGVTRAMGEILCPDGHLPCEDRSLDAIVVPQSLEHMADPALMLAEIARVLKPGGQLLISARNRVSRAGADWARGESQGQVPLQGPWTPLRPRALLALLAPHFTIEELAGLGLAREGGADALRGSPLLWRRRAIALRARLRG